MTANVGALQQESAVTVLRRLPAWVWFGAWIYVVLLINGSVLLNDSDTYWHIAVGQWILDNGAFPHTDIYSFTKFGEHWISTSWLAQVVFAAAYRVAGWAGPISLSAMAGAGTFAYLAAILSRRIAPAYAVLIAFAALVLAVTHFFVRPHLLAMPVMLAWANGLLCASERREAPSFWLLPLIALWANLHGGFVFGLVLVGGFGLDALWNEEASKRRELALRWFVFGIGACAACCVTPYGWETIIASYRILDLGQLLHLILEWMPTDFSSLSRFELCMLVLIAGALHSGVKLSPPRIALVLGLLHMALSHVRSHEIFALLLPLVVLTPVVTQFAIQAPRRAGAAAASLVSLAALLAVFGVGAVVSAAQAKYQPPAFHSPAAAVDILKQRGAKRIFHDAVFGGYLISRGIPVFIDGRAELYGEQFVMDSFRAMSLKDVNVLYRILKDYQIDAVLLKPDAPAALLLDHLGEWTRLYGDKYAVLYMRTAK